MKTLFLLPLLAVIFTLTMVPAMASKDKSGILADNSVGQMLPMQKGKPPAPPKPIGPPKSGDE